jgi:hypothetical protein
MMFETASGSLHDRMRRAAYPWPRDVDPPPRSSDEALSAHGRWGQQACGVAVRQCEGAAAHKGRGAFTLRILPRGSVVGVYWGVRLTQVEYRRKAERSPCDYLCGLLHYDDCGELLEECERTWPQLHCYIDCEDEATASWCRFINHKSEHSPGCNLSLRTDCLAGIAWFEASRDISAGEELAFDYGPRYASKLEGASNTVERSSRELSDTSS